MRLLALPFLLFAAALPAAETAPAAQTAAPKPLPGLPWHMMNLWWEMPETADFQSLDIDVRIKGEVDPSKLNLYIAPIGIGQLNGVSFYGGIQSNIGGYPVSPDSPKGPYHKGKGAIFSRWGHHDLDTSFVRAAADGLVEAAGYEGDFASGRRPYAWGEGSYTYSLRKLTYEKDKDGKEWTWVGAFVTDKATGHFTFISSLKFPGRTLAFWGRHSAFIEIYGGKPVDIAALPALEIAIGQPRVNGKAVEIRRLFLVHPDQGPVSPPIMSGALSEDGSEIVFRLHNRLLEGQKPFTPLLPRPAGK